MFDEEDYEDYFVGSDSDEEAPRQAEGAQTTQPNGRPVINFGGDELPQLQREDRGGSGRHGCMTPWLLGICAVVIIAIAGIGYFRYLSPIVEDAVMDVYVSDVQRRGVVFKTIEADVVVADKLVDTQSAYTHPVGVTVADDVTAHILQSLQSSGKSVRVRYRQYAATLPWRGESKIVVTGIVRQ